MIQRYSYSSFGKIFKIDNGGVDKTTNPDIKSSFTYTNREYDSESGLYYYRARYYDPALGRFLTEDPHPGKKRLPQSVFNEYSYSINNPISYTDPSGKFIFAAAFLFSVAGTTALGTATVTSAAIIGFTGTLAFFEAKHNFDTSKMLDKDGAKALGVAAAVAVSAAGGAWFGLKMGQGIASVLNLKGAAAWAFEGALVGAFASSAASATTSLLTGNHESAASDAFTGFGLGLVTGGVFGVGGYFFRQPITIPLAVVTEGGVFFQFQIPESEGEQ